MQPSDRSPYKFEWYTKRAKYKEKFGVDAPPYDPSIPIKYWLDDEVPTDLPEVVYPNALMVDKTGTLIRRNGAPVVRPVILPVEQARSVNLPDEDQFGNTSIQPGTFAPVPCPINMPGPGEALVFGDTPFTATSAYIRNLALYAENQNQLNSDAGKFTPKDREMLTALYQRLVGQ